MSGEHTQIQCFYFFSCFKMHTFTHTKAALLWGCQYYYLYVTLYCSGPHTDKIQTQPDCIQELFHWRKGDMLLRKFVEKKWLHKCKKQMNVSYSSEMWKSQKFQTMFKNTTFYEYKTRANIVCVCNLQIWMTFLLIIFPCDPQNSKNNEKVDSFILFLLYYYYWHYCEHVLTVTAKGWG